MGSPVAIVGNSLAGVVLINPHPAWGGHLAGMTVGERRFDGGMVLYEFGSYNREDAPDPLSYDPAVRNDCGRFVLLVRDYVQQRISMSQAPDPAMWYGGRCLPDLIIGNHVESLSMLPPDEQRKMREELERAATDPDRSLHASVKNSGAVFQTADYATVSLRNHGATFHEHFIEPLCRKILGAGTREILALYHRAAWLPLYYPETLLSQLEGQPSKLPATHFHYPASGSAGALVDALRDELLAAGQVRAIYTSVTAIRHRQRLFELQLEDGTSLETCDLVWTHDLATLNRFADSTEDAETERRAGVGLCLLAVPEQDLRLKFSTLFVPDPRFRAYRITDPDVCAGSNAPLHRLVVEFSTGDPSGAPADTDIARELVELGVLDTSDSVLHCGTKILHKVLPLPDDKNRRRFREQQQRISEALPSIRLIGPASGFLATSINDQIVQGLKLGIELGGRPT